MKKCIVDNDTNTFTEICDFALGIFSLPHSNADCKQMFSGVNCTKTRLRCCLKMETINELLHSKQCVKSGRNSLKNCVNFEPTKEMYEKIVSYVVIFIR